MFLIRLLIAFSFIVIGSRESNNFSSKVALITGVTGQDGVYLADFLLKKGYEVHGIRRRSSGVNTRRIDKFLSKNKNFSENFYLHYGDLLDSSSLFKLIKDIMPDEVYNLAAQSHVRVSFDNPIFTADVNALGTLRLLDAIKAVYSEKKIKFYQASTSEMFGKVCEIPQNENTAFYPRSPYAASKLFAHWMTKNYREAYGIFACSGILFNHESFFRGDNFVTKKITQNIAKIYNGSKEPMYLGNLDSKRDWGYAKEYVEAMWLMLQQDNPDDYVIATGETHSVREFIEIAFDYIGIKISWQGEGVNEVGYNYANGDVLVKIDEKFFRPAEVDYLIGDCSKAKRMLNWSAKTTFKELVEVMMKDELEFFRIVI